MPVRPGRRVHDLLRAAVSRSRSGSVDGVVASAIARFGAARSVEEVLGTATEASGKLLQDLDSDAAATVVLIDKKAWRPAATTQSAADGLRAEWRIQTVLQAVRSQTEETEAALRTRHELEVADRSVLFVPLLSLNEVRGAMIVEAQERLSPQLTEAFTALSGYMALALEATDLAEDLNRHRGDRRYRALVENSVDATLVVNKSGEPLFASSAAEQLLRGVGQSNDLLRAVHPQDRAALMSAVHNAAQIGASGEKQQIVECRLAGSTTPERWIEITATDMTREPHVEGIVLCVREITERKLIERDLRHRVLRDELTGIANGTCLRERMDHALSMRRAETSCAALLIVDINDFETFNEVLGAGGGDEILKVIGFRLESFVRGHDTAARIKDDTFAVFLPDLAAEADVQHIAARLLKVAEMPLEFDGRRIDPIARVGVCVARAEYDAGILLRNAEAALQDAELTPGRVAVFSETMSVSALERMDFRRELARAIDHGELTIHYQPQMDLRSEVLVGFEALIRWEHPERGLVSPASFIPAAEETGLIVPMGAWILNSACTRLAEWRARRPDLDLEMSVNVSGRQLMASGFVDTLTDVIARTGIPASALMLELTETDDLKVTAVRERLAQLRDMGVGLAADDFGSGFASYSALQQLPFTVAKVDRSVVSSLANNFDKASEQLGAIIEVAHSVNLTVTAEGIEDESQRAVLASLGCDRGQGWLFGKPLAVADAERLIIGSPAPAAST